MSAIAERWTAERVRALPDDNNRYEVIGSELFVTPAPRPRHQIVISYLMYELLGYLEQHRLGVVLSAPSDIEFAEDTLVQPDISVASLVDGRPPASWSAITAHLLLTVEVLSPRTAVRDRGIKRQLYQREAVGEYWIVDIENRVVERWRSGSGEPTLHDTMLEWQPSPEVPPLVINLAELFAKVPTEQNALAPSRPT